MANKVIHKRSIQQGLLPSGTTLDYGEIAVNYNSSEPFLSIRTTENGKTETNYAKFIDETAINAKIRNVENQNAFSIVAVSGQTTIEADSATDTLIFAAGSNISITTDASNDKITIAATGLSQSGHNHDTTYLKWQQPITYSELKTLRDNSQLVPGQQYRITDYVTTTTQADTQSAGHQFDIIVTADDESTLNEIAKAIQHDGNTYFADIDINAWQIWYCLDNDTERFIWADTENGKGVIYRMIDEFNNDCPYDFKNIQFEHPNDTTMYPDYYYTFSTVIDGVVTDHSLLQGYCYDNTMKEYISSTKQHLNNNVFLNTSKTSSCSSNSFGNDCGSNSFGSNCKYNSFGNSCSSNSFGNNCSSNSFGNNCINIVMGGGCRSNVFGQGCADNLFSSVSECVFGIECYENDFSKAVDMIGCVFGNYTYNNTCSADTMITRVVTLEEFYDNSLSGEIDACTFGDNCHHNTFDTLAMCTFGSKAWGNKVGSLVRSTFLEECHHNTIGVDCSEITFGNYSYGNTIGDNCRNITFENGANMNAIRVGNTDSAGARHFCRNICFEEGVSGVVLYNSQDALSEDQGALKNIVVKKGIESTSSVFIEVEADRNYETSVAKNSKGEIKVYCEADLIS